MVFSLSLRFWFVILSIIGGLQLIYRLILMFAPSIRNRMLKRKVAEVYEDSLERILNKIGYSEWFLLKLLAVNIDTLRFGELCEHINRGLNAKSPNGRISSLSPTPSYSKEPSDDEPFLTKQV